MLSWMGRTTLEIIGQVGFGHTFDNFANDEPDEFRIALKSFLWASLPTRSERPY